MTETPSLFADPPAAADPEPAPASLPCPPWLAKELVALGVRPEVAAGYSLRQAFGVRDRMRRQRDERERADRATPTHELFPAVPAREQAARDLEHALARSPGVGADPDYVCRVLREAVCFLTPDECRRVAKGLLPLLRAAA